MPHVTTEMSATCAATARRRAHLCTVMPSPLRWRMAAAIGAVALVPLRAQAWGDEGHEIVALIADHYLQPAVHDQVVALLAGDPLHLTPDTSIASEATWADKFRDSDRPHGPRYTTTHNWHYVDIEIDAPDIDAACFQHPVLAAGTLASAGVENDCVTDKIGQFAAELKASDTPADERREALQFLLHFVGDVHQPLHASDRNDQGGNAEIIAAHPLPAGNLHHYWDTEFVAQLGSDPAQVAQTLIAAISAADQQAWSQGTPETWAQESFAVARDVAFGLLPAPTSAHHYTLPQSYVDAATPAVALQLQRAGVRLAAVLNDALGGAPASTTCNEQTRSAALVDLAGIAGITPMVDSHAATALASARWTPFASALPFVADAGGVPAAIEGRLLQTGWEKRDTAFGSSVYSSVWTVRVAGCGALTGSLVVMPTATSGHYVATLQLLKVD